MLTSSRSTPHARRGLAKFLVLFALATLASPLSLSAQSVSQILTQAWERNESRLARIDNLRMQQEVMGIAITTYMVKEMVDGDPILRPHSMEAAGLGNLSQQSFADGFWHDGKQMYLDWADRWRLEGRGSQGGAATYRLVLDRFDGINFSEMIPSQGGQQFTPTRMAMDLEVDRLIPLSFEMDATMTEGAETRPVSVAFALSDYREVSGYLYPALTVVEMDIANSGISPEQMAQARQGMMELQRQLEQMPEAQRRMMETMMGGQLAAMSRMFSDDGIRLEMRVTDAQANVTLP